MKKQTMYEKTDKKEYIAIHKAHLTHYTFNDKKIETEIFELFENQVQNWIQGISEDLEAEPFRNIMHGIKGSARAIGAMRLVEMAENAEIISKTNNLYKKRLMIRNIKREIRFVLTYIKLNRYRYDLAFLFKSSQAFNS